MKIALFLFALLGALAAVGSLVPQGKTGVFYRENYGEILGSLVVNVHMDYLYSSWWFIALSGFLIGSTLFCSVRRAKKITGLKGLGLVITHFSVVLIFIGAIVSALTGQSQLIRLAVGDSANLSLTGIPAESLTVKNFTIEYYDDLTPKQYISSVALQTKNGEEIDGTVSINHPLRTGDVKIYQKSYGWMVKGQIVVDDKMTPFNLANGEELVIDPGRKLRLEMFFFPDLERQIGGLQTFLPDNPQLACALIEDNNLIGTQAISRGETKEIRGTSVTFTSYGYYTGLEVKNDKGIVIVYTGFGLLLFGLSLRYLAPYLNKQGEF